MSTMSLLAIGVASGIALPVLVWFLLKTVHVEVEDGWAALVTRWGRLEQTLREPGWHWVPGKFLPWVQIRNVSLNTAFRTMHDIRVHDARGTTVIVDVWLEVKIKDPAKALFHVTDWDVALKNVVSHAVLSILGSRRFEQILSDRNELGALLREEIASETTRWGLEIESVYLRKVSLLPEVAQGLFMSVAARLERARADVEEDGRQRVALLDAETSARVARLVAEAKSQYPAAVGRAYARLGQQPKILTAFEELYKLAVLRPHRTIAFQGFADGEIRAVESAMLVSQGDAPAEPEVRKT